MKLGPAAAIAASVFTIMAVGGIAGAAIPGPDGVKTCYIKSTGVIRVIDSEAVCKKTETTLLIGAQGAPGVPGADGADGVSGYTVVSRIDAFDPGTTQSIGGTSIDCPTGRKAFGGGGHFVNENGVDVASTSNFLAVTSSFPNGDGSGWSVRYAGSGFDNFGITGFKVYVTCANVA